MTNDEFKIAITNVFSDIASKYDSNLFFDISARHLIDIADPARFDSMLDVTTGTGVIALSSAQINPNLKIDAVDMAEGMLEKAREKANLLGISNIRFINCDIEKLNYSAESFDLITCGYGMFFFPNMLETYKNLYKMLKPGGKLIFSSFKEEAFLPCTEMFIAQIEKYDIEVPKIMPTQLNSFTQINELTTNAGIENFKIVENEIRYKIPAEGWWSMLNSVGYKGLINQIKSEELDAFKKEFLMSLKALDKGDGLLLNADSFYTIVSKIIN